LAPDEPPQPAATSVRLARAAPATTIAAARAPSLRPCLSRGWGRRLARGYASSFTEAICRERSRTPGFRRVTAFVTRRDGPLGPLKTAPPRSQNWRHK
jgi:hypothetical protein